MFKTAKTGGRQQQYATKVALGIEARDGEPAQFYRRKGRSEAQKPRNFYFSLRQLPFMLLLKLTIGKKKRVQKGYLPIRMPRLRFLEFPQTI